MFACPRSLNVNGDFYMHCPSNVVTGNFVHVPWKMKSVEKNLSLSHHYAVKSNSYIISVQNMIKQPHGISLLYSEPLTSKEMERERERER